MSSATRSATGSPRSSGRTRPSIPSETTAPISSNFLPTSAATKKGRPSRRASISLLLREWLADLHQQNLAKHTIRRKLSAVRGLFDHLLREGVVRINHAKLLLTPKMPKRLPAVPTEQQANGLIDGVAAGKLERPMPERDLAMLRGPLRLRTAHQ